MKAFDLVAVLAAVEKGVAVAEEVVAVAKVLVAQLKLLVPASGVGSKE